MVMTVLNVSRSGEELSRHLKSNVLPVTVFISVEACVGFFGNIAILLVYSKQYRKVNFRYFVLALAFLDFISCCTTLPGEVFSQIHWYDYKYTWICKIKSFFNVLTAWGSASILLILAIDRYRKICHPCDWQIRVHVASRLSLCCLIMSVFVSIPALILWGTQSYLFKLKGENFTVSVCEKSGDYADTMYPLLYIIVVYLVPVSIMIISAMTLNFIICCRLFGHHSVKNPSVKLSVKVRPGISEDTKTTDDNTDEVIRTEKPKGYFGSSVNQQTNHFHSFSEDSTTSTTHEHSTDDLSTDDDGSSDLDEYRTDKTSSANQNRNSRRSRRSNIRQMSKFHRKYKTMIMLILTTIFAVTMGTYIILTSFVAKPGGILKNMSDTYKPIFFFFWRLYFVNSVVNPILYGFMDPGFRSGFMHYLQRCRPSVTRFS